jgi:GH35 family endo-1,4-beta-xylanase
VRARRARRAAVAVLSVMAAALASASTALAAPRDFFGLVPNSDLEGADYRMIREANVGAARVSLFWQVIEARNDRFDWSGTDRMIGEFASRGIRSLPLLFGTPAWLSNQPVKPPLGSKRKKRQWMDFLTEAVERYGQGGTYWSSAYPRQFPGGDPEPIDTWQIWNEQNGPKHFHPRPSVKKYGNLLRLSDKAITGEEPGAEIVVGGMASQPTGPGGINAWTYVRKLLKKKAARRSLDHAGLHPYAGSDREVVSDVKRMRRTLKKGGKRKAEVWITELGWSSSRKAGGKLAKTPQRQAKLLEKTYRRLKRKRKSWGIGGVYWYTWRDFQGGICDWCPDAGLVNRGRNPKPAYGSYKRIARG